MKPQARLLACIIALLVGGGLVLPAAQAPARLSVPQIDAKALDTLRAMDAAFARADGLDATYRMEYFRPNGQPGPVETTTLRLGRPNVYLVETSSGTGAGRRTIIASDGTTRFTVRAGNCTTWKAAPRKKTRELDTFNPIYWS